jgi:hypothetical protein
MSPEATAHYRIVAKLGMARFTREAQVLVNHSC